MTNKKANEQTNKQRNKSTYAAYIIEDRLTGLSGRDFEKKQNLFVQTQKAAYIVDHSTRTCAFKPAENIPNRPCRIVCWEQPSTKWQGPPEWKEKRQAMKAGNQLYNLTTSIKSSYESEATKNKTHKKTLKPTKNTTHPKKPKSRLFQPSSNRWVFPSDVFFRRLTNIKSIPSAGMSTIHLPRRGSLSTALWVTLGVLLLC